MTWLLILCLHGSPNSCEYRGGITAVHTTEAQCRAALALNRMVIGWCISPRGEVIRHNGS